MATAVAAFWFHRDFDLLFPDDWFFWGVCYFLVFISYFVCFLGDAFIPTGELLCGLDTIPLLDMDLLNCFSVALCLPVFSF